MDRPLSRAGPVFKVTVTAYTVGGFLTFIAFCGLYADHSIGTFPYLGAAVACLFWPVVLVALLVAALRD